MGNIIQIFAEGRIFLNTQRLQFGMPVFADEVAFVFVFVFVFVLRKCTAE